MCRDATVAVWYSNPRGSVGPWAVTVQLLHEVRDQVGVEAGRGEAVADLVRCRKTLIELRFYRGKLIRVP